MIQDVPLSSHEVGLSSSEGMSRTLSPAGLTYDDAESGKLFKISIDQAEVRKKSYANNKAKNNETRKLV